MIHNSKKLIKHIKKISDSKSNQSVGNYVPPSNLPDEITSDWIKKNTEVTDDEVSDYVINIEKAFRDSTINDLLIECKNKVIEAIVNPLGLGRLLAVYDKIGGNVDTIHNVREGIYASDDERKKAELFELAKNMSDEKLNGPKPENISDEDWKIIREMKYDPKPYHAHPNYRKKNEEDGADKRNGNLDDSYSDNTFGEGDKTDLDHTKSAEEIHYDPARILAEMDGADLANIEENLNPTSPTVNRAKKQKSVAEFLEYVDNAKQKLNEQIQNLENKPTLNENQVEELKRLKRKLDALDSIDEKKMREKDEKAREVIDKKLMTSIIKVRNFFLILQKHLPMKA